MERSFAFSVFCPCLSPSFVFALCSYRVRWAFLWFYLSFALDCVSVLPLLFLYLFFLSLSLPSSSSCSLFSYSISYVRLCQLSSSSLRSVYDESHYVCLLFFVWGITRYIACLSTISLRLLFFFFFLFPLFLDLRRCSRIFPPAHWCLRSRRLVLLKRFRPVLKKGGKRMEIYVKLCNEIYVTSVY